VQIINFNTDYGYQISVIYFWKKAE